MKAHSLFILFAAMLFAAACRKSKSPYTAVVYLEAASVNPFAKIVADTSGGSFVIKAATSGLAEDPVLLQIEADTTLIAAYNQLHQKAYKPLPPGSYRLTGNNLSINAGSSRSDEQKLEVLSIKDFKDGESYMLPVTIKSSSGSAILNASRTLFIEVGRVQYYAAVSLSGGNYFTVDFSKNNEGLDALANISYEARVKVNKFQSSSPFISTIMGIEEEFLLRFGDVTVKPNQLQLAGGATAINIPDEFATDTWYHIAGSYDGTVLKIYINGKLAGIKEAKRTINLLNSRGFYFGRSTSQGRYLDGAIGEVRIWNRPLTQSEIVNGMCGVDPASPGLIGYWKFNGGTGNIAYDISGNEHNATAAKNVTWMKEIRCN